MSEAMKLIVAGYIRLKNRRALEDMRVHRQGLRNDLKRSEGCLNIVGSSIRLVDEDILAIEGGLRELNPAAPHASSAYLPQR
jgi:hypothetical protein